MTSSILTHTRIKTRTHLRSIAGIGRTALSRKRIAAALRNAQPIKIEVGAGARRGCKGWLTIDVNAECDLYWDLRRGIPFPKGRVSAIYSSHFLEHLTYQETQAFLDECLRVLIPGGTFSVCVPNARLYIEAYLGLRDLDPTRFMRYLPAYNDTTRIDIVNYTAYMAGEHKYMWDEENLLHILRNKGFVDVLLRDFDPDLDLEARDYESIYAIARR